MSHFGVPEIHRWTVDTTGGAYYFKNSTIFLQLGMASGVVRLYFAEADYAADDGSALASAGEGALELDYSNGDYYEGPALVNCVWMRAIGGDAVVTLVGYHRRGA